MAKEKLKKATNDSPAKSLEKLKEKKLHQTLNFDNLVKKQPNQHRARQVGGFGEMSLKF